MAILEQIKTEPENLPNGYKEIGGKIYVKPSDEIDYNAFTEFMEHFDPAKPVEIPILNTKRGRLATTLFLAMLALNSGDTNDSAILHLQKPSIEKQTLPTNVLSNKPTFLVDPNFEP